jgi:TRAP-type C4-dicarboxylate transport system permease small subunit
MRKKVLNILLNIDLALACITLAALILFTFSAVVMRYIVNQPITWGEEFQLFCIVIVVFFGAGAGFRLKSHVAIDIVVDMMPEKIQKVVEAIIYILAVIILGFFFIHSARLAAQMARTARITNILKIPFALTYATFPISCVLMIINYSIIVYKRMKGIKEEEA